MKLEREKEEKEEKERVKEKKKNTDSAMKSRQSHAERMTASAVIHMNGIHSGFCVCLYVFAQDTTV